MWTPLVNPSLPGPSKRIQEVFINSLLQVKECSKTTLEGAGTDHLLLKKHILIHFAHAKYLFFIHEWHPVFATCLTCINPSLTRHNRYTHVRTPFPHGVNTCQNCAVSGPRTPALRILTGCRTFSTETQSEVRGWFPNPICLGMKI